MGAREKAGIRIIGPNCLGLMNPHNGLNATFAANMARPGSVGFISQSGALCTAILDWSQRELVGFSAFVSVGSMLDVGWGDLIQYLGDDPNTQSIMIYMESVGDARSFLSAAREVALSKPIIVIKSGRTEAAAQAAASHTGALTGSDEVLDAAFRRCGVLRVNTIAELFYTSEALGKQPRPKGPRLTIVTNAGGPGVLATDALLAGGGKLAPLADKTMESLNSFLPANTGAMGIPSTFWETLHRSAGKKRWRARLPRSEYRWPAGGSGAAGHDGSGVGGAKAEAVRHVRGKPVLASWMGGPIVAPGERILNAAGIPTFSFPDSAAGVFQSMWLYSQNLQALYQTPALVGGAGAASRIARRKPDHRQRQGARTHAADRGGSETRPGRLRNPDGGDRGRGNCEILPSRKRSASASRSSLKLHSETITHKTDVGGVRLNLAVRRRCAKPSAAIKTRSAKAGAEHFLGVTVQPMVKLDGYELILGSSVDSQFGPVILFGSGGQLVEIYKDRALALPPLNTTLARR